jgi:hypothetical protein
MFVPYRKHTYEPPETVMKTTLLFHIMDDDLISQETHLLASTDDYEGIFTLYIKMMFPPQETHLLASTACYGDRFTFLYN